MKVAGHLREQLSELFLYDETSPSCLRWKVSRGNKIKVGDIAGSVDRKGYYELGWSTQGARYRTYAHKAICLIVHGTVGDETDHEDQDVSNNKSSNLRSVTRTVNRLNSKVRVDSLSGITGVVPHYDKNNEHTAWIACYSEGGIRKRKHFPFSKHSPSDALSLAIECRSNNT